jgi:predicted PurR-regulated permease PerM
MADSEHRGGLAGVAAVASVLAASSCCLPIFPFVMGAAFAGGSAFLSAARPYLLAASVLFIAFGFYQGWRAKRCNRRSSAVSAVLLWLSTVFVAAGIFFPQTLANAAANLLVKAPAVHGPIENLSAQNIGSIAASFNGARGETRVLLFFSPT